MTGQPQPPRVPARRGTRRIAKDLTAVFGRQMTRADGKRVLADHDSVGEIAQTAMLYFWDGKRVLETTMAEHNSVDLSSLQPARRIGTHNKARSKFGYHTTRFGEHLHSVLTESLLEVAWMRQFDRRPQHWGYIGQPCAVRWQYGSRTIVHIPDVAGQDRDGTRWFADMKYTSGMTTYSGLVADLLMRRTCTMFSVNYEVFTDMGRQRRTNLGVLAMRRWRHPVVDAAWWPRVERGKPETLRWLAELAGGGAVGRERAIRVIAQCHADTKLSQPLDGYTPLVWRQSYDG